VDEAATDVVVDWQRKGITEPWTHPLFVDSVVLTQKARQVKLAESEGIQFYDRSPICTLALAQWLRLPVSEVLQLEIARMLREEVYRREVFFLRSLGFMTATEVRRISLAESMRFGELHEELYLAHGFQLIYVEPASVEQRVGFIRRCIAG
jgi:predicted ATPase